MKRIVLLAATAVIAATSFGATSSHAAATLGKRKLSSVTPSITSDSPMTLFSNRGPYTSRLLTSPSSPFGTQTSPSGTPCREVYQPGPNGTLGGYLNPCTGAWRPAVN